jgi:hypothetical protein
MLLPESSTKSKENHSSNRRLSGSAPHGSTLPQEPDATQAEVCLLEVRLLEMRLLEDQCERLQGLVSELLRKNQELRLEVTRMREGCDQSLF